MSNPRLWIAHWWRSKTLPFYVLLATSLALPIILILHSVFATRELNEMRSIFLRDRVATIAARLETMSPESIARNHFDDLFESEPGLLAIRVFQPGKPPEGNKALAAVQSGEILYSAGKVEVGGKPVFRAYLPFHSGGTVNVAQIDLSLSASDFILVHARHNVITSIVSGSAVLLLALYALWATRLAARLETQRIQMESLAQLGRLSAVLAHEIRNPLGAIKGFAQLARENAAGMHTKPLDAILRECKRLEKLVNALLLYGKPLKPSVRACNWEALAAELQVHAKEAIGSRPIRFEMGSRVQALTTDPDLLEQVLLNLIRNSIEAIPQGSEGKVRLDATARNGGVVIAVEDTGPGIPDCVRSKLFSPFLTTKASGTGLGLAISKKTIDCLGGTLQLRSVVPHGTRAEVALYGQSSGN